MDIFFMIYLLNVLEINLFIDFWWGGVFSKFERREICVLNLSVLFEVVVDINFSFLF